MDQIRWDSLWIDGSVTGMRRMDDAIQACMGEVSATLNALALLGGEGESTAYATFREELAELRRKLSQKQDRVEDLIQAVRQADENFAEAERELRARALDLEATYSIITSSRPGDGGSSVQAIPYSSPFNHSVDPDWLVQLAQEESF